MIRLGLALVALTACRAEVSGAGASRTATSGAPAVSEDLRTASCIGPKDARSFVIYLHGLDAESPSAQEMGNREVLAALARKQSLRIALPRAKQACPGKPGTVCWGWGFDDAEVAAAAATVREGASSCFGDQPATVVGFSNGGYLLTKVIRSCALKRELPNVTRVITVGAGMVKGPIEREPRLEGCGELTMVVGTKDEFNFDPGGNLLEQLRARGASVREVRFDGAHVLDEAALAGVLGANASAAAPSASAVASIAPTPAPSAAPSAPPASALDEPRKEELRKAYLQRVAKVFRELWNARCAKGAESASGTATFTALAVTSVSDPSLEFLLGAMIPGPPDEYPDLFIPSTQLNFTCPKKAPAP